MGNGISRREFFKLSGVAAAAAASTSQAAHASAGSLAGATVHQAICPLCALGCGLLVHVRDGKPVNIEGDPEHAVSEGTLCARAAALLQTITSPLRITSPMHRPSGAAAWQPISWGEAIGRISLLIKSARDEGFDERSRSTSGIATLGGASLSNEAAFALQRWLRSLGVLFIDHQGRMGQVASYMALMRALGRGRGTAALQDLQHSGVIMAIGANPAQCHPVLFKLIERARAHGASFICIDPRFTHSASRADIYAPLAPGSDHAFLMGLIKYIIDGNYFDTSAALDIDALRQQSAMYDEEFVFAQTGMDKSLQHAAYEAFCKGSRSGRRGSIICGMGLAQSPMAMHTISCIVTIQALLGNLNERGGGIYTLRGQANSQGAIDQGLLFDWLPGHLPSPTEAAPSLEQYISQHGVERQEIDSLLGDMFPGVQAQRAYELLPLRKRGQDYSESAMLEAMLSGSLKGMLLWGQNIAASSPDSARVRRALSALKFMVSVDMFDNETSSFWRGPGVSPSDIKTECFLLPAAFSLEREGSMTSTDGTVQQRPRALAPPGEALSEHEIIVRLGAKVADLYVTQRQGQKTKSLRYDASPLAIASASYIYLKRGPLPLYPAWGHGPQTPLNVNLPPDPDYPYLAYSIRTDAHGQSGVASRHTPMLYGLCPEGYVEMSIELAEELRVRDGDKVLVLTPLGQVALRASVTHRLRPLRVRERTMHHVGVTWFMGWMNPLGNASITTDSLNLLVPRTMDNASFSPLNRHFAVNIKKA